MTNKPTLTLKKPLRLEQESQVYQTIISSRQAPLEKKKLSKKEQEYQIQDAQRRKKEGIKALGRVQNS